MQHVDAIDRTVETTQRWIDEVGRRLDTDDRQRAYRVLRVVLQELRDRVGVDVSAHLAAQLPLLVRGLFYEGWHPASTPSGWTLEEFLDRIERNAYLKGRSEAEDAVRAVLDVLRAECGEGALGHVVTVLPTAFADFA